MIRILLLLLLILVSSPAVAADISTNTCPGAGCVTYNTSGQGSIGIQIIGTWTGTITFQATIDNANFVSLRVVSVADTTSTGITTTTGNGSWQATVSGLTQVRVAFTGYMSGTASVFVRTTVARGGGFGGGGGGGGTGTVTHTAGNLTATDIVVGNAGADITVSSCTIDGSGNLSCPGTLTGGSGSATAGNLVLVQGTLPGSFPANSFALYAPTSISTSYQWRLPTADAAGLIQSSGAGTPGVLSILAATDDNIPVGNGTAFALSALPNCVDSGGNHLNYTTASNAFSCGTSGGLSAPVTITGAVGSTALTITGNTQTANFPPLVMTQTWNAGGVSFVLLDATVTDTASASTSLFIDFKVGANHIFKFAKNGTMSVPNTAFLQLYSDSTLTNRGIELGNNGADPFISFNQFGDVKWNGGNDADGSADLSIARSSAGVLDIGAGAYTVCATAANCRDLRLRHLIAGGSAPTVANVGANSCGTTAATIAGNDLAGEITVGATSGSQCRITFSAAAPTRWDCIFSDNTTANVMRTGAVVDTTHADVIGTMVAGDIINYHCIAR